MHGVGRYIEDVAGSDRILRSAFNRLAADFVRAAGFAFDNLAADENDALAGSDQQQIGKLLVDLRLAVAVAVGNECGIEHTLGS